MTTKADKLREELSSLRATSFDGMGDAETYRLAVTTKTRIDEIRAELAKLARQRVAAKARREMLFDLNGHHGRA